MRAVLTSLVLSLFVMTSFDLVNAREVDVTRIQNADQHSGQRKETRPRHIPREIVEYFGPHKPGTVIVAATERRLYLVLNGGFAIRYGIGVARPGFEWRGIHKVSQKREWPGWTPPEAMKKRQPGLPDYMPGGPNNPLGARALYIGSTLYRIHGTNDPKSIGQAMSSGCIRMINDDVIDLYNRVKVGALVVVTYDDVNAATQVRTSHLGGPINITPSNWD